MSDLTKANPTVALILHYLGVGAIFAIMFYMSVIAKVISPGEYEQVLLAALVALGVYKIGAPVNTSTSDTKSTPTS